MQFLFPLTPTRIGPGVIAARERLVNKHSGSCTVPDAVTLRVLQFNSDDLLVAQRAQHGPHVTLTVPHNGAVVVAWLHE